MWCAFDIILEHVYNSYLLWALVFTLVWRINVQWGVCLLPFGTVRIKWIGGNTKHKPCILLMQVFWLFDSCNHIWRQNISLTFDNPDYKCYQYAILWYENSIQGIFMCCHYFLIKLYCEVCWFELKTIQCSCVTFCRGCHPVYWWVDNQSWRAPVPKKWRQL